MIRTLLPLVLAPLALAPPLAAQSCPPHWSTDFGLPGVLGSQPSVDAFEVFDDGTGEALYVGGLFSTAGGVGGPNIARWRGLVWTPVGVGLAGRVRAMFVHNDGTGPALYAGGEFFGGVLRWDGISWKTVGSGLNGPVYALGSFDDGTGNALFAAGQFTVAGGVAVTNIARWKNGNWSAVGAGLSGRVNALAVYNAGSGSRLYAGGEFITSGPNIAQRIASWNGITWSPVSSGANLPVRALGVYNDGSGTKLYAGGDFTFVGGVPALHVARYDSQGWAAVGAGLPNGSVLCFTSHDDGGGKRLFAGGAFSDSTVPLAYLARWDGQAWSALGSGPDSECRALIEWDSTLPSGSALYAGGTFVTAGGFAQLRVSKWDNDQAAPTKYCTAKVNSLGCKTAISSTGVPSTVAGSGFTIQASNLLPKAVGLLFYSKSGSQAVAFQGGWLCMLAPTRRTGVQSANPGSGCVGTFTVDFNAYIASGADPGLVPGASVWCQWWSRDPGFAPPNNTNLTEGLQFFLCQ